MNVLYVFRRIWNTVHARIYKTLKNDHDNVTYRLKAELMHTLIVSAQ